MMNQINLIELFVFVVIPGSLSGNSSSSEPRHSYDKPLNYFTAGLTRYESAKMNVRYYSDDTKFDYTLKTPNEETVLENKGKNTDIVFCFHDKVQFYVKGKPNVLYSLEFERPAMVTTFANDVVSTTPARYKKCQGSNTYKIKELRDSTRVGDRYRLGDMWHNWCIFKERKGNVTTFMIKWIGPAAAHLDPFGVFRSTDYKLERVSGADSKLEFSILFNHVPLGPKYILETPTPEKLEAFLK